MDETSRTQTPSAAAEQLSALYEGPRRPIVSHAILALSVLATAATVLRPELSTVLGGIEPRAHLWQPFTAPFVHGWPGFPALLHLALNALLILEAGRPCERLLGSRRFLALSLAALAANAVAIALTEGVNGSSLVIWSWGPPLLVALAEAGRRGARGSKPYQRLRGLLVIMYGVLVIVMGLLPYLYGWRGNPLAALLLGNAYHLIATAVGAGFAVLYAARIRATIAGGG